MHPLSGQTDAVLGLGGVQVNIKAAKLAGGLLACSRPPSGWNRPSIKSLPIPDHKFFRSN